MFLILLLSWGSLSTASAQAPPNSEAVVVARVIDGDTIQLQDGTRVRLIGVDTPETVHPSRPVEEYGKEASAFTRRMLEGARVYLEYDVERFDRYGRTLAYVWLPDGTLFNELLLFEGYAQVSTFPPNVKYVERFLAAQRQAREAGSGLWAGEGTSTGGRSPVTLTVDLAAELASITNVSDSSLDVTGWVLVSVKGNQRFTFPPLVLAPGETVTVTSGRGARHEPPRYLRWTESYIWNNDGDPAELRDAGNELIARWP